MEQVIINEIIDMKQTVKTVTVGKNVTSIGKSAFEKCTSLTSVTVNSTTLKTIGSNAFNGDKKLTRNISKTKEIKPSQSDK